jgi:cobalt-precorrin-5B (C1)-methyltransferase
MNARLGIVGGLSILGTTGVVVPYSCSSWIHSIRRGIDVARAAGLDHIAESTGAASERAVQRLYDLPDHALIDMGDFAGGTLKYLRGHPVVRLNHRRRFRQARRRTSRSAFGAQPGRHRSARCDAGHAWR